MSPPVALCRNLLISAAALVLLTFIAAGCGVSGDDSDDPDDATARPAAANSGQLSVTAEIRSSTVVVAPGSAGSTPRSGASAEGTASIADTPRSGATAAANGTSAPATTAATGGGGQHFRFGSLEVDFLGWEPTTETLSNGDSCAAGYPYYIGMFFTVTNTAAAAYSLGPWVITLVDRFDQPISTGVSLVNSGATAALTFQAGSTTDLALCAVVPDGSDGSQLTLRVGETNFEQVRIPLSGEGEAQLGSWVEAEVNQTFRFRGAEINLTSIAVTTGVWNYYANGGQAPLGKRWLVLMTDVQNGESSALYISDLETRLEFDGSTVNASFWEFEEFRMGYSIEVGLNRSTMTVFEIPAGLEKATLHLVAAADYQGDDREVTLELALPTEQP